MPQAELRLRAFAAPGWRGLRIRGDEQGNATVAGEVTGGRTIRLRSQLPLIADDSARTWIHLTVEGAWEGHPMGPFEFDEQVFAQLISNFEGQANAVPLTYEHPEYGDGQPKPAAGWIHELQAREDGLWAYVEFTDRAAEMIRAGEYRYCSVVVVFDSVSREDAEEIGAELLEVGLTNSPFIDGQQPIQLTRATGARKLQGGPMDPEQIKSKLRELQTLLGVPGDLEGDDLRFAIMDTVNALLEFERLADMLSGGGDEVPETAAASRKALANRLGLGGFALGQAKETLAKVKLMIDVDKLKSALDALAEKNENPSPEQVKQVIEGALLQQNAAGGESGGDGEDDTAASHDPPKAASDAPTGEGGGEGEGERQLAEDPEARNAAAGEALSILEESLGMDVAGVLDFLRTNADKLAEMAGGMPEGGGAEAADAQGAMSKLRVAEGRVKRLTQEVETLKAKEAEREAEKRKADAEKWFAEQLEAGRVAEGEREHLVQLRQRDPKWCDEYIGKRGAQVPMGRITGGGTPSGDGDEGDKPKTLSRKQAETEAKQLGSKGYAAFLQRVGFGKSPNDALEYARKRASEAAN